MKEPFPHKSKTIFTEWLVREGGIHAAARTDETGQAYIAIKTINRIGKTSGWYDWHRCYFFESDMAVGFVDDRQLMAHVAIMVNAAGIELIVTLPPSVTKTISGFMERRFSPWGSGAPTTHITIVPTIDHYATHLFPAE